MRNWSALLSGSAVFAAVFLLMPDAEAQSFFQKIFGFGSGPQFAPQPIPMPRPRQIIPPQRFRSPAAEHPQQSHTPSDDDDIGPPDSAGPFKTLCVRTCDGYYFPLRHNAHHKNFAADVKSCQNACGGEGRLFYYSLNGAQRPEAMVDLAGHKYAELPHAFAYRKKVADSCTCKPAPWSSAELARHQSYADAEAIERAKAETVAAADAENKAPANGAELPVASATTDEAQPDHNPAAALKLPVDLDPDAAQTPPPEVPLEQPKLEPKKLDRPARRRSKTYAMRPQFQPASYVPYPSRYHGTPFKPYRRGTFGSGLLD